MDFLLFHPFVVVFFSSSKHIYKEGLICGKKNPLFICLLLLKKKQKEGRVKKVSNKTMNSRENILMYSYFY